MPSAHYEASLLATNYTVALGGILCKLSSWKLRGEAAENEAKPRTQASHTGQRFQSEASGM